MKLQTLQITVPNDAEDPARLVRDALERYCGSYYPVGLDPDDDWYSHETSIVIHPITAVREA